MKKILIVLLVLWPLGIPVIAQDALTVDENGNVGIGVSNPEATLDVDGTVMAKEIKVGSTVIEEGKVTVHGTVEANRILGLVTSFNSVPEGTIAMWAGSLATIPDGWVLCDGMNETPDLRDRFILGVRQGEEPGGTGGEHTLTLTAENLPTHTHRMGISGTHGHTGVTTEAGEHTHTNGNTNYSGEHSHAYNVPDISYYDVQAGDGGGTHAHAGGSTDTGNAGSHSHIVPPTAAGGLHTHQFTLDLGGEHTHNVESAGVEDAELDNRPAFFRLAFIMKKRVPTPPQGIQ